MPSDTIFTKFLACWIVGISLCGLSTGVFADQPSDNSKRLLPLQQTKTAQTRELAQQIVDAYGGLAALKRADQQMLREVGKVIQYSTISGATNSFDCEVYSCGDKLRVSMNVLGESLITGYDGEHSWMQQGGQVFRTHPLAEKTIKDEINHGLLLLEKLLEPSTHLELLGTNTAQGKRCDLIRITRGNGVPTLFYADKNSHLILKSTYEGLDAEQGVPATKNYTYEDYRPVAGSLEPYLVTEYCGDQMASQLIMTSIEPASVTDAIFALPAQVTLPLKAGETLSIPFDFIANEIVISAKADDTHPLTLVVDTGATQSILDQEVAKTLGPTQASKLEMTTGSGSVPLSYMTLPQLQLGTKNFKDLSFAVTDLSAFAQIIGRRPSGLLGANLLRRFLVTIDYDRKVLTLANPTDVKLAAETIVVPAKPALGVSGLLIDGWLDGQQFPFLVDTGAAFNNISDRLAKPILTTSLLPVGSVQGLDGHKIEIGSVQFKTLKIGALITENPIFSVAPSDKNPAGLIAGAGLAILGNPFWSSFSLTVDYQNQRILLNRTKTEKQYQELLHKVADLRREQQSDPKAQDFKKAYETIRQEAHSQEQLAIEALCAAYLISMTETPVSVSSVTEQFNQALGMAAQSGKATVRGKVAAIAASYYLNNLPTEEAVPLSKKLLLSVASACPAEPSIYVTTAILLNVTGEKNLVGQLLNQALMLDPANWEALWLKYKVAADAGDRNLLKLVVDQLERYYPNAPSVVALNSYDHG